MLAAAKTTGAATSPDAGAGMPSPPSTLRVNATAPIVRPSIRELSTRRGASIVKPVPHIFFVNSEPYIANAQLIVLRYIYFTYNCKQASRGNPRTRPPIIVRGAAAWARRPRATRVKCERRQLKMLGQSFLPREIGKPRHLGLENELDGSRRAVPLLADDDFGLAMHLFHVRLPIDEFLAS